MSIGVARPRRPKSGRRKLARIVLGLALFAAALFVFRYATEIAGQIEVYVAPPPEGGNVTGLGSQFELLPLFVWGFGFTLIGIGANTLRTAFVPSGTGAMGGAFAGGTSLDEIEGQLQQMMAATRADAPRPEAPKEVVKVKCRNCGNLEPEDAAFCRKCGQPL